jgi:2-dehydro-3-deoxyphosphogluconate aldolase/(4S)-4-hydroxy-2-oxoglutarate aldolase
MMHKKEAPLRQLLQQKLLPLYYHESSEKSIHILQALFNAGVRMVEYTHRGGNAFANFKLLRQAANETMPGLLLGIGTVKTIEQSIKYIESGADFIVSPLINEEIAAIVNDAGLLWIPGCMTPTEIGVAEKTGATLVKIFPGNILGPSYLNAIKELFPGLHFMPTGGIEIEEDNLKAWFKAGAKVVGIGSKLINRDIMLQENYEGLKETTVKTLALVKQVAEQFNPRHNIYGTQMT